MKLSLEPIITIILVACAVVTTSLVIHHELFGGIHAGSQSTGDKSPAFVPDWRAGQKLGIRIGSADAPVQLLEFADFECPFCRQFHEVFKRVEREHPNQVSLMFIHFPISGHRFALPAARVAACAGDQGKFDAIYDKLFEEQDQFGLKPWSDYAAAAHVPDMATFDTCIRKTDPIPRLEEGKDLGAKLDVQGTPTVIINGWKLGHPPSADELDKMIQRVLAGKQPIDGKS
jgi:protein-disulfide isomerase